MKTWKLNRTTQCAKCPWRKDVNPHDIPNGYSEDKHRALESTIAKPDDYSFMTSGRIHIMVCHEAHEAHCVGWLLNQLGPGNNIGLRLHMRGCANGNQLKLAGAQHETFEETIPTGNAMTVKEILRKAIQ